MTHREAIDRAWREHTINMYRKWQLLMFGKVVDDGYPPDSWEWIE